MRTTFQIDDEVLEAARRRAETTGSTVDRVTTDLAREGFALKLQASPRSSLPVFEVAPDAATITPKTVRRALRSDDRPRSCPTCATRPRGRAHEAARKLRERGSAKAAALGKILEAQPAKIEDTIEERSSSPSHSRKRRPRSWTVRTGQEVHRASAPNSRSPPTPQSGIALYG